MEKRESRKLLDQIESLLELQNNEGFRSAKEKFLSEQASKQERETAKRTIFNRAVKSFILDETLEPTMSDEYKNTFAAKIKNIGNSGTVTDEDFYSVLNLIKDKGFNTKLVRKDNSKKYALAPLNLIRKPMQGTLPEPIKKRNWKRILIKIAAGTIVVVAIAGAGIIIANFLADDSDEKGYMPNIPGSSQGGLPEDVEDPTGESQETIKDTLEADIQLAVDVVYENWKELGGKYDKATIEEVIRCLSGLESTMSQEEADEILVDMLNMAIVPGINNALGSTNYETNELDFASLIVGDVAGLEAVERMEDNLNGCLTDSDNMSEYASVAFEDQARVCGEDETVDGLNVTDSTTTAPGVRLVWSRLAIGVNGLAGTLGDDLSVKVNGNVYTQNDINNATRLEQIASDAKKDMGDSAKTLKMSK